MGGKHNGEAAWTPDDIAGLIGPAVWLQKKSEALIVAEASGAEVSLARTSALTNFHLSDLSIDIYKAVTPPEGQQYNLRHFHLHEKNMLH